MSGTHIYECVQFGADPNITNIMSIRLHNFVKHLGTEVLSDGYQTGINTVLRMVHVGFVDQ